MLKKLKLPYGMYVFALFMLTGLAGFFIFDKGEVEIFWNQHHNFFSDYFFKYWTYLGDGVIYFIMLLVLLFYRYYYSIVTLIVLTAQTAVVQILKRFIFPDNPRPRLFFEDTPDLHFVSGVKVFFSYSFPSGHTAVAFAVATLLTFFIKNKMLSLVWYLIAVLVGLSRVYLFQHFFIDVYAGAAIGVLVASATYILMERTHLAKSERWNRSMIKK